MSLLRRRSPHVEHPPERTAEPTPAPTAEPTPPTPPTPDTGASLPTRAGSTPPALPPVGSQPVPRTRTGAAWVGLAAAALIAVALIVFLVQNTRSVEISFLWMTARASLAIALLIAALGSVLLTLTLGTARITQLRRLARRRRT